MNISRILNFLLVAFVFIGETAFAQYTNLTDISFGKNGSVCTDFFDQIPSSINNPNPVMHAAGIATNAAGATFIAGGGGYPYDYLGIRKMLPDGADDPSFGGNGLLSLLYGMHSQSLFKDLYKCPDGKMLATGFAYPVSSLSARDSSSWGVCLYRFLQDGQYDTTFGKNGKVLLTLPIRLARGTKSIVLSDGKILCAARTYISVADPNQEDRLVLIRLLPNGQIDKTFGQNGWVEFYYDDYPEDYVLGLAQQADGKLLVGDLIQESYHINYGTGTRNAPVLFRLLPNGAIDSSFAEHGKFKHKFDFEYYHIKTITVQPDQKIIAGGYARGANRNSYKWMVFRLLPSGAIDSSFGLNGIHTSQQTFPQKTSIENLIITKDLKILAGGYMNNATTSSLLVFRLKSNGSIDSSYYEDPNNSFDHFVYRHPLPASTNINSSDLDRDELGNFTLLASHDQSLAFGSGYTVVKVDSLLRYRRSFNPNLYDDGGYYSYIPGSYRNKGERTAFGTEDYLTGTHILPNGRIVQVGAVTFKEYPSNTRTRVGITRLLPDGQIDTTYGKKGKLLIPMPFYFNIRFSALQGTNLFLSNGVNLIKLDYETGKSDSSFAINGMFSIPNDFETLSAFDVLTNGKIVFLSKNGNNIYLTRLKPDGRPDSSFGTNGRCGIYYTGAPQEKFLKIMPDGRILVCTDEGNAYCFRENGTPDVSFGGQGTGAARFFLSGNLIMNTDGSMAPIIRDVTILPDGKILLLSLKDRTRAAAYNNGLSNYYDAHNYRDIELYRLTPDGKTDSSFGNMAGKTKYGALNLKLPFVEEIPGSLLVDKNTIYIAGYFSDGVNWQTGLLMVQPDGSYVTACALNGAAMNEDQNINVESFSTFPLRINKLQDSSILLSGTKLNRFSDFYAIKMHTDATKPIANVIKWESMLDTSNCTDVLLQWTTAYECNVDSIQIQYSLNGTDYRRLSSITGAAQSSNGKSYSFRHTANKGDHSYRLLFYNHNGDIQTSRPASLRVDSSYLIPDLIGKETLQDTIFSVQLQWKTTRVFRARYFEVQKSTDSLHFTTDFRMRLEDGEESSRDTGDFGSTYFSLRPGTYYFRVVLHDDCNTQESKILKKVLKLPSDVEPPVTDTLITPNPTIESLVAGPNPADTKLKVMIPSADGAELFLYNEFGVMKQRIQPTSTTVEIDCTPLSPGIYILVYQRGSETRKVKFIKV